MGSVVLASNILVQYPFAFGGLSDYLTWGAFSYPFAFLVTDLSNRRFGPARARRVVYAGFVARGRALGLARDAPHRDRVRRGVPGRPAPRHRDLLPPARPRLVAAALRVVGDLVGPRHGDLLLARLLLRDRCRGSGVTISDVLAQVGIADECVALPWVSLAVADYGVKLALAALSIAPYGALLTVIRREQRPAAT